MELDLGTAFIGGIATIAFTLPFVLDYRKNQHKMRALLTGLKDLAAKQGCQIHSYEVCKNFIVGIDEQQAWFFFLARTAAGHESQQIDLKTLRACEVVKQRRSAAGSGGDNAAGGWAEVGLVFISKNPQRPSTKLTLYDHTAGRQLTGEIQLANKWAALAEALRQGNTKNAKAS
jgi:hypothetical protein